MTNPWKQIDAMQTKYVKDMEDAKAAARSAWSAAELIRAMTLSHEVAEKKKTGQKEAP